MKIIGSLEHVQPSAEYRVGGRLATRAIVMRGDDILLLYTARYDDYSLPGGGVEAGETFEEALCRELAEETGARNVRVVAPFGLFEEYRPWSRDGLNAIQMRSYCYICQIDDELDAPNFETYEVQNGMQARWVNIHHAIAHNKKVLQDKPASMGLSIVRETMLLRQIVQHFGLCEKQIG